MWFIEVWTWCSWRQLDLIHLIYLIWACSPSLYLIWVAIVLDCNFIQLDIIVLLLFELTRGGITSLWSMKLWSCMWVIKKWLKEDLIHLSIGGAGGYLTRPLFSLRSVLSSSSSSTLLLLLLILLLFLLLLPIPRHLPSFSSFYLFHFTFPPSPPLSIPTSILSHLSPLDELFEPG